MGFFIGKSGKGKGKAAKRKSRRGGRSSWDPRRTLAAVRWVAAVALVVGGVLGWLWGERWLRGYVSEHRAAVVRAEDVEVADVPGLSPEVAGRLQLTVADYVSDDPLDGRGLVEAREALLRDGWVERVHQVRRVSTGSAVSGSPASMSGEGAAKVRVWVEVRTPVARVRDGEYFRLVDGAGRWLPWDGSATSVFEALPVVAGVRSDPPGEAGGGWTRSGEDLAAAVAAVRLLGGEPFSPQVVAYDVSERDAMGRVQVVLQTRHGRVVWGLAPGREGGLETDAIAKRDRLRELAGPRGDWPLNARAAVVYVDGPTIEFARSAPSASATFTGGGRR